MSDTFVTANKSFLVAQIKAMVQMAPWTSGRHQLDRTGTTRIGKYLLNHSFMIPGFIGVGVSTVVA